MQVRCKACYKELRKVTMAYFENKKAKNTGKEVKTHAQ